MEIKIHYAVDDPKWMDDFDVRQRNEIEFCLLYAIDFAHGTDGHNIRMIVAKMAKMLQAQEDQKAVDHDSQ